MLRVIPSLNPAAGGPIEGASRIDAELLSRGHWVEAVSLDVAGAFALDHYPGIAHCLGPSVSKYGFNRRLKSWLRENVANYDIVLIDGIWQYHSIVARTVCISRDIPYYLYTHGMLDPWFKHKYPLKHLKKLVYWNLGEYRVIRDAQSVIFTCEEEKILARKSFSKYSCKESISGFGTADPPQIDEKKLALVYDLYPNLHDKKILLFLGRLHEKKGCELVIQAFAKVAHLYPTLMLIMAGPGNQGYVNRLKQLATDLGILDRVVWTGMISGDLKWATFAVADAFILPSHQENFGVVVAEALALGKPVLLSNKVNIWREIIEDRVGWIAADDMAGTLQTINEWLSCDAHSLRLMSQRAIESFASRYKISIVVDKLLSITNSASQ